MPCRSTSSLFVAFILGSTLSAAPAFAANGIDTASGVTNLPFSIEGTQVMDMTKNGLAVYGEVSGENTGGSWNGCFGQECGNGMASEGPYGLFGSGTNIGVMGESNGGWGGQFIGNGSGNGVYGQTGNGQGVEGVATGSGNGVYGQAGNGQGVEGVATGSWWGVSGTSNSGWGGMFTGASGVYGQTANGQGVEGVATGGGNGVYGTSASGWSGNFEGVNGVYGSASGGGTGVQGASNSGWGVYGTSTSGWAGVFKGTYGVYGESANGGWAAQFNSTNAQNGVYISNDSNNALLCLNGSCVTTLPSGPPSLWSNNVYNGQIIGPYTYCALGMAATNGNAQAAVTPYSGSPGAYYFYVRLVNASAIATCF